MYSLLWTINTSSSGSVILTLLQETKRINDIIHKLNHLLPTDLQHLSHDTIRNRFVSMTFSETTHLNTVLISGLLCHIAVFLIYAENITFLHPITQIHYNPTSLLDRYLPAISTSIKPLVDSTPQPAPLSPYKSVPPSKTNVKVCYSQP